MGKARTGLRRGLLTLLALLVLSLAWAAVALLSAEGDVRTAEAALDRAPGAEGLDGVRRELATAETALRRADDRLSGAGPVIASWIPLLGRTPSAARTTVRAALAVAAASGDVVDAAAGSAGLVRDGRVDLEALSRLQAALDQAADRTAQPVADLQEAPTSWLPGRLASGVREAQARLSVLPARLAAAADAAEAGRGLLGQDVPRSLLFVLENNAELRGTGGLVSVFAEVRAQDGLLSFDAFTDVDSVAQDRAGAVEVPAPDDYRALWGPYKANTTLWKNVNMAPDVPVASGVLAGLAEKSLGRKPDGVVWLDVRTIAAVIGATGDATLPDGTVLTGENTVTQLLSEAYANVADNERDQGLRRLRLRAAADLFVQRLTTGAPDAATLGPALGRMAAGRHLAVWSAHAEEQQALVAASVGGALSGPVPATDIGSAVINNFGDAVSFGNKLDFYARRQLTVTVRLRPDEAVVEQVLAVRNTAPDSGLPTYVAGRARPGTSNNHISLALPADAREVRFVREQQDLPVQSFRQGDHQVVVDGASLAPGTTATWTLRYRVPVVDGRYLLRLVPQPLAVDGGLAVTVTADAGTRLEPGPGTPALDASGALTLSGPFERVRELSLRTHRDSLPSRALDRLKRFWNEPVTLP